MGRQHGFILLSKNHVQTLSPFLPLSLTQGDLACLAEGEEREQKDEWPMQSFDGQLSYLVQTQ